ncbi:MAG: non-homologous end-joining DNA ligase [Candidatus Aenigmatarchaeota archaeon]
MILWNKAIKPMLAEIAKPFSDEKFCFEIKFDGTRTIAYIDKQKKEVRFLNRRGIWFQNRYLEMKELWKDVEAEQAILDGELVVFKQGKPDFYLLAEREHVGSKARAEILSKLNPATLVVFDVLHLDGKDLVELPLIERKKILEKVVKESSRILISAYVIGEGEKFFEEVKAKGLEGVMAKRIDSNYEIGKRSKNWLKIKALNSLDAIICGYTLGEGKREKYFGALLLGAMHEGKLRYIGKVGTGWEEKDLKELAQRLKKIEIEKNPFDVFEEEPSILEKVRWCEPKLVCEVQFLELTEDLKLRAPSFKRLREDKAAEECSLEI